ncbi:MAG: HEAT repeat domain-containing protein [Spirochaetes bacterium]|nr:HEAT repeat domain-containing protein [Spirochaetota bacterium]MBU1081348.1 HEAT repeat domain-containing protein [Spirochaetota bacterium]
MKRCIVTLITLTALAFTPAWSQAATSGERTVEESYLQDPLETMIIREQAYSDSKDMKLVALQYITQSLDEGRAGPEVRKALDYLATESSMTIVRAGGVGRALNNYPDVRREACLLLGQIKTVEAKDTLLKVALVDTEPMVIAAAIRSIGKIGLMTGDDVTQTIAFVVNRFDILFPDNSLAFESLVALEALADANNGIKDPAAIRAIMKIADGNYITPVRQKAKDLLSKLRKYSASSSGAGK